jgi:XTP/dITP diphosphohydrolase
VSNIKLIFASSNKHKIEEIAKILPAGNSIVPMSELGITGEIPETGKTIEENSLLKAQYVFDKLGKKEIVIADDSGLEVFSLDNKPGVHSARYAGEPKNDANNNKKLLEELIKKADRRARFVTVITLLSPDQKKVFEGEVKGSIAFEPRGKNGFGYDPLFIPQGYRSTFAELSAETKNNISHRANAVKKMLDFLKGE